MELKSCQVGTIEPVRALSAKYGKTHMIRQRLSSFLKNGGLEIYNSPLKIYRPVEIGARVANYLLDAAYIIPIDFAR